MLYCNTMFSFREKHLFSFLDLFEKLQSPLDVCLNRYFRQHKALGANDRRAIGEVVYSLMRWRGLLDWLSSSPHNWMKRYQLHASFNPSIYYEQTAIPPHIRASFPKNLFAMLAQSYGEAQALTYCFESNFPAPLTVRINPLKITREELLKKWQPLYPVAPTTHSPFGIFFKKRMNFHELDEFRKGFFEVQDEASQLVSALIQAKPGQKILDFCAGAGGKTLAFAHSMKGKGQIYLHDPRHHALRAARGRFSRAGFQNIQFLNSNELAARADLFGTMDWVLTDVPCSGTGTLRRNPDLKWKFNSEMLDRLIQEQRKIVERGLLYLKKDGLLVYATCSLLREENDLQLEFFQKKWGLSPISPPFRSFPKRGEMDGFFAAVLYTNNLKNRECEPGP